MTEATSKPTPPPGRQMIQCAKCGAENLAGSDKCHECGAHLYLSCPACGRSSVRTLRRCVACDGRIGRSRWARLRDKVFGRFGPLKITLGLLVLAVVIKLLIMVVNALAGPPIEEPTEPEYNETVNHGQTAPAKP